MDTGQFIQQLEITFENLIGVSFQGLLGLILGLFIFSFLLFLLKRQKKNHNNFNFETDNLSEVGNPIEANINLARSLIEMKEINKAKDCIRKVELEINLTQEQKDKIRVLKQKFI
tara:strand:+ start:13354 stop:13698 length:345 start_codon:yes stop_codon:yes gene_type:complete